MTITVDDRPNLLLELLWLREAYALHPAGENLPPLLLETPESATATADDETRARWQDAWAGVWRDVATHAGLEQDPRVFDQLRHTLDGSPERAALLHQIIGPSWSDEFGREALDDPSHRSWDRAGFEAHVASRRDVLEHSPERRDLDALIVAWRAGLTKVVTIPCRGEYTRRLGPHAMLVTDGTRADSEAYQRALNSFASPEEDLP